jgi:hypothetical protein
MEGLVYLRLVTRYAENPPPPRMWQEVSWVANEHQATRFTEAAAKEYKEAFDAGAPGYKYTAERDSTGGAPYAPDNWVIRKLTL